jgi:SAM-dependent methyltransferase
MVVYATQSEIEAACSSSVGTHDYVHFHYRPHTAQAILVAQLQLGQSVLDVGAGAGRFIAAAKKRVQHGHCVAVDAVQGFLDEDLPFTLSCNELAVAPDGTLATQVHCIRANLTHNDFADRIPKPEGSRFDCIAAIDVFTTLAPGQRLPALVTLRRLLKPGGRLLVNLCPFFLAPSDPAGASNVPVQFSAGAGFTEAPGCVMVVEWRNDGRGAMTPRGRFPDKAIVQAMQIAPDYLWQVARVQGRQAAEHAGFAVDRCIDIGKADHYGLHNQPPSPPKHELEALTFEELSESVTRRPAYGTRVCIGRALHELFLSYWPDPRTDRNLVLQLQQLGRVEEERVRDQLQYRPANAPVDHVQVEHVNVGVLMVLRPI